MSLEWACVWQSKLCCPVLVLKTGYSSSWQHIHDELCLLGSWWWSGKEPPIFLLNMNGPLGSVYDGGLFPLDIALPSDDPFKPPKLNGHTSIYLWDINSQGAIYSKTSGITAYLFQRFCSQFFSQTATLKVLCLEVWPFGIWPTGQSMTGYSDHGPSARQHNSHNRYVLWRSTLSLGRASLYTAQTSWACYADSSPCLYPLETERLPKDGNSLKSRTLELRICCV